VSTVVFLGGGRITSAMLAGLRLAKVKDRLVVHDRNDGKLRALKRLYHVDVERDLLKAASVADLLIIAVRPHSVRDLLRGMESIRRPMLAVSVAAGIPLRAFIKALGARLRWARAMPSPVCRTGRGLTAVTFPATLPHLDRKCIRNFFLNVGQVVEIPETKFDAFTVTYSSSHGYHALATLAKAAQEAGLDRKTALLASAHALADGITAWRDSKHRLESLVEEAATPGGIAEATIRGMNSSGYRRAVQKGMRDGLRQASLLASRK
jgi:pyrroline-5-carboxylate reductase